MRKKKNEYEDLNLKNGRVPGSPLRSPYSYDFPVGNGQFENIDPIPLVSNLAPCAIRSFTQQELIAQAVSEAVRQVREDRGSLIDEDDDDFDFDDDFDYDDDDFKPLEKEESEKGSKSLESQSNNPIPPTALEGGEVNADSAKESDNENQNNN